MHPGIRKIPQRPCTMIMFRVLTPASPPPFIVYRLGNLNHGQDTRALTHSLITHSLTPTKPTPPAGPAQRPTNRVGPSRFRL